MKNAQRGALHPAGHRASRLRLSAGVRELPESLEALVESGFMPPRYLTDENGYALRSGATAIILSRRVRRRGWQHRWQGLDARR